jgi:hypothetical protein
LRDESRRQPIAAIIDSQSVKASESSGERGREADKKINGKHRILVETTGQ